MTYSILSFGSGRLCLVGWILGLCLLVGSSGSLAVAQTSKTPVGADAPDEGRWVEVEVPAEIVNEARKAAGQVPLRPKSGATTISLRYQRPVERRWSFLQEITRRSSPFPALETSSPRAVPSKATDGTRVINGIDYDENANLTGSFSIPADPHGAVGLNHICHVVNTSIQCFDKSDGASVLKKGLDTFFSHDSGENLFDPRVVYDPRADRWVVLVLNKVDNGTASDNVSEIFLAASDGSDPAGTWDRQTIDMKRTFNNDNTNNTDTECWFDYPGLALGEEAIYVTGNYFAFESESESGLCDTVLSIFDQGIYSGSASTLGFLGDPNETFSSGDFDGTLQPAFIYGPAPASKVGTWVVQYSGLTDGTNEFWLATRVDYPLDDAQRSFTSNLVSWGSVDSTSISSLPNAPQPDTSARIETNDRRALDLVWRDDQLWGTTTVIPPPDEPDATQATAHYGQIDVSTLGSPSPVSNGFLGGEDVETGAYTYFPSVAVDASGNAAFGFSLSGPSTYAGAYLVTRPASGGLSGTKLARNGVDRYYRDFGGSQNRWGDYSAVEIDPADGSVWTINKVALQRESGCTSECGRWGAFLTQFSASVLPVELIAFHGRRDGQAAVLTWKTGSETQNAGFRIEHRAPGDQSWQEETFVKGEGSTTGPQRYRYRASGLKPGVHRFRLVQVDRGGSTMTRGPVKVAIRPEGRYALQAPRPNPTRGDARLRLAVRREQRVRAHLYNTLGQNVRVLARTTVQPSSPLSIRVDGTDLPSGVYFVRVDGESFVATRKLTILR